MKRFKDKPIRVDLDFESELREIKVQRIKKGKDDVLTPKSDRRLTKAIRRHPLWPKMREDIVNADLLEDYP